MLKKIAAATALLLSVVGFSAPANAYPLGNAFDVSVSSPRVDPGQVIKVYANNAAPGCYVTFTSYFDGKRTSTVSVLANGSGYASTSLRSTKPARVVVNAGFSCNGVSESDSVSATFGRESALTVGLTAASGALSASGYYTNAAATAGVGGAIGTATFYAPNGAKVGSSRFTTNSSGYYAVSASVKNAQAGSYRVDVVVGFKTPYFGQSGSATASFNALITAPVGGGKAVGKAKPANHRAY